MKPQTIDKVLKLLSDSGVELRPGLSESEFAVIEETIGSPIPQDYRDLLSAGVPQGPGFPDWAANPAEEIQQTIEDIVRSFHFDIEENQFWNDALGARPVTTAEAKSVAEQAIRNAPRLLRIYGHRYLPTSPSQAGNPILSFLQPTDVIYYGENLHNYFLCEFGDGKRSDSLADYRDVPFWSAFI